MWGCVGEILIHIFAFTFTFYRLVDDWKGVLEWVGRDDMREMYAYFFTFSLGFFCVSLCVWKTIYYDQEIVSYLGLGSN